MSDPRRGVRASERHPEGVQNVSPGQEPTEDVEEVPVDLSWDDGYWDEGEVDPEDTYVEGVDRQ